MRIKVVCSREILDSDSATDKTRVRIIRMCAISNFKTSSFRVAILNSRMLLIGKIFFLTSPVLANFIRLFFYFINDTKNG